MPVRAQQLGSGANVRLWHKADMLNAPTNVRFLGAKRTLTNRCLPISIYEYTPLAARLPSVPRPSPYGGPPLQLGPVWHSGWGKHTASEGFMVINTISLASG
jgi:hypothetical protein